MSIEAMKKALEALDWRFSNADAAIEALRQAIEQAEKKSTLQEISDIGQEAHTDHPMRHWDRTCPACVAEAGKQEPFGYFQLDLRMDAWVQNRDNKKGVPFYTAPPKREWVGLTDKEIFDTLDSYDEEVNARQIEALLKKKNT
jgi:hypothetical protein